MKKRLVAIIAVTLCIFLGCSNELFPLITESPESSSIYIEEFNNECTSNYDDSDDVENFDAQTSDSSSETIDEPTINISNAQTEIIEAYYDKTMDKTFMVTLIESPLDAFTTDFQLASNFIKNMPAFKDYVFGIEKIEVGYANTLYDVQQTGYQYSTKFCGTTQYNKTDTHFNDIYVQYTWDTRYIKGLSEVKIKIPTTAKSEVETILQSIFSNDIVSLFMHKDEFIITLPQECCIVTFSKSRTEKYFVICAGIQSTVENSFHNYQGDYKALIGRPDYSFDVFCQDMGDTNVSNILEWGSNLFPIAYPDYYATLPGMQQTYTYTCLELDSPKDVNGHKAITFSLDAFITRESDPEAIPFKFYYDVIIAEKSVIDVSGNIIFPLGEVPDESEKSLAILSSRMVEITKRIMGLHVNISNKIKFKQSVATYTEEFNVLGLNKRITFNAQYDKSPIIGWASISF